MLKSLYTHKFHSKSKRNYDNFVAPATTMLDFCSDYCW